ncbi:PREDICTED: uncharacterized protein LOC109193526 [Ipomoea nil]|uniref:uncharacterized protein LOC109193526 n=1 Tax=Ipomoea nil TaxID=35883 RepID=UPI000901A88F|nr:PREDICTED: uncharacterized protein LOC109193526 [Ipomoea nil]
MSTLSWNCRGLGNPRTVREVVGMVSKKQPDFVFLIETKVARDHAERLRVTIGFEGLFYVDNDGLSGGLALLWKKNNTARLLSYSRNYVDIEVTMTGNPAWRMTCYYGYSDRNRRAESWDLLRMLAYEKRGGNPHPNSLLRGFGETIEDCGLAQLPMIGYPYTWEKGKGTANWIEERLDKVLVTNEWRNIIPHVKVMNLRTRKSDHSAIFFTVQEEVGRDGVRRRGFRFEMTWLYDEGCRGVVEQAWQEGRGQGLQGCVQYCENRLTRWGGDRFHNSGGPGTGDDFFGGIEPRVSQAQNDSLLRPFNLEEVKDALFAMYPDKAPGPDGMNPGFYQHFWDVVRGDVASFVLNCLESGDLPSGLNETDIVLIPKKSNPELVTDLRPIALSNVIYRIIAKMMANRMKPLMEGIISETQSAFIPDRLITDNILLAAEVGHFLNRKQCGLRGWGALKLDMAKAYDRMEWPFLRNMMMALGFHDRWVDLIMECVTTVSYSILINGSRSDPIIPTRGLRQGDPLSPYLFIICAEGLSLLLQQANRAGLIHGCRVARGAPQISHLFFADDSLLFFKANVEEANEIKKCLTVYEDLSGQVVNYHKSSICYSRNTSNVDRESVAQVLGVEQAPNFGKYLGLPSFAWRMLTKPDSLVARVYKSRYFPRDTFFDAQDPMIQTEMPIQLREARVVGLIDQQTVWEAFLPRPGSLLRAAAAAKTAWTQSRPAVVATATATLPTENRHAAQASPTAGRGAADAAGSSVPPVRRCRVDAGYLHETGNATVGAVLLDGDGAYISALTAPLPAFVREFNDAIFPRHICDKEGDDFFDEDFLDGDVVESPIGTLERNKQYDAKDGWWIC